MGTARPGFWPTAEHEAAKMFGRRFWKVLVAFRLLRRVWVPLALLVFVAAGAGIIFLAPPVNPVLSVRVPEIPEWGFWLIGTGIVIGLAFIVRPVRWFLIDLRYRILP